MDKEIFLNALKERILILDGGMGTMIAALARRYGLMPAFALGAILALLFVWRRAATFVPPPPAAPVPRTAAPSAA